MVVSYFGNGIGELIFAMCSVYEIQCAARFFSGFCQVSANYLSHMILDFHHDILPFICRHIQHKGNKAFLDVNNGAITAIGDYNWVCYNRSGHILYEMESFV